MSLLEETIAAHGGAERWAALDAVELAVQTGGLAFRTKGQPQAMRGAAARVATTGQHVVWEPFPEPGQRGVFTGEEARIETVGGEVLASTARPRGRRWSPVDMLAFASAALWTYVSFPFVLAEERFDVRELSGRRLAVRVPHTVRSHSRKHVLLIGEDGLIRRHDYTAEAFGSWARAANLCLEQGEVDGLRLATRRRVVPRAPWGRPLPGPTLV